MWFKWQRVLLHATLLFTTWAPQLGTYRSAVVLVAVFDKRCCCEHLSKAVSFLTVEGVLPLHAVHMEVHCQEFVPLPTGDAQTRGGELPSLLPVARSCLFTAEATLMLSSSMSDAG